MAVEQQQERVKLYASLVNAERFPYLREPVVHLMCDANSLLGHREVGHLRVQMRVVDGNCGLHGETFERLLIVVGERAGALLLVG